MLDASESLRLSKLYEQLRLKLLDLSLKNRMLNYSLGARSKRHLLVVDEVLDEVYKKLVEEEVSLRILPLDEPADIPPEEKSEDFIAALQQAKVSNIEYLTKLEVLENQGRDDDIALARLDRELRDTVRAELGLPPRLKKNEINRAEHARSLGIEPSYELPAKASKKSHNDQALQTLKFPDELESVMDKIADTARLAEQEMGLSTLFLAFGFLEWYESDSSDRKAFAPLLLLPVRLEAAKSRGRKIFYLSAREGSAETNLSLRKRLDQFPCELPDFDSGEDEKAASIDKYLQQVKTVIEGRQRWNVRRWLVLGHFAFGRSAMYADLNPENWKVDPVQHSLVSSILRGTEDAEGGDGTLPSIPEDYHIDDPEIEKVAPFLIQDADASQHSALVDVMRGKNLVIQGPPGTGKSQTITNIIANAMEAGKRVLFLSEKQAALEVVKRRLAGAGLGDFCLELHSDKSSPRLIIEDLKQRAEAGSGKAKPASQSSDIAWHESRKEMGTYLSALHAEQPDGATPFDLIWSAVRGRSQNANVVDLFKGVALPDRFLDDPAARAAVESKFSIFVETSRSFSDARGHAPAESPWRQLDLDDLGGHRISPFLDTLEDVRSAAVELAAFMDSTSDLGISSAADVGKMICADRAIEEPAAPEVVSAIVALDPGELERALGLMIEWHNQSRLLAERPDLSHASLPKLSVASALMRCGLPAELARMTPAELYEAADNAIPRDRAVLGLVQRLLPILALFGFDENLPSGALMPLALAVLAGAKVRPEHRRWVNALRRVDPAQFWKLKDRWTAISTNESKWRGYCAAYGRAPWPSPEEFEIHAAALRKSGMKKAWAALHGSLRVAREFAAQFGFAASADVSELLDRLGKHARLVRSFEGNEAVARVLGNDWRGLATAFEEIGAGFKLRQLFQEKIGGLPHGEDVAERLVDLAPDIFDHLNDTSHIAAAVAFSKCPTDVREQFDTRPLARLVETYRNELAIMEKASSVDQSRSLSDIELPIVKIAEIAEIAAKRDALSHEVNASPVSEPARRLGESAAKTAQAVSTIKWVRAVNTADMPFKLRDKLLSGNAREERLRLRAAAERGGPIHGRYVNLLSQLCADFGIASFGEMHPNELATKAGTLVSGRRELADYLSIRRYRSALVEADLGQFVSRAEELRLSSVQLPNLFNAIIAARRALRIFAATGLAKNSGAMLDAHRRQFADRDRKKIENDRVYIRKVLLQKKPEPGSSSGPRKSWTEMALLQNEFSKQKRFTPVRSLLMRAGRSIQAFKPCFMMSPLSLAKFVPADRLNFDVLVIDEASQMKPEDALGSLLRVGQIVVVGDQKQLPPTDFFNRSGETTDDEDFEDVDDESILESCQKAFRDVRRLKWHYRSRCESLIRFSNENFYRDSPLITFPSAKPGSFSIDLIRVDGVYQFHRNVAEASLVAQKAVEIMRRYAHADAENIPTLGIATVNIDQRDLLQEELNRVSAGDALVEQYHEKVAKKGEPVFVKNLENVQGDERDVILISLTYGREAGATAMKQRFGPINGKQGHRRLNVLFTRARIRIGLFTSFGSADIKPTDASAEGVHVLKRYLEYAECMGRSSIDAIGGEADSDFEIEVADRLRAKSYDVERQVGVSGYKIDIGVRDPDHPERFLAGVECDGARYHSGKSARDRDRLREEVLRGLGWEIVRVWSTDWFEDPARETDKLAKKLQELRERPRAGYDEHSALAEILLSGQRVPSAERPITTEEPVADTESAAPEIYATEPGSGTEPPEATPATGQPTSSLPNSRTPLTREQGVQALVEFRDTVIRTEMPDMEVQRSILRDAMIETFISQNVSDPDEWFRKVPKYLRQGTSPVEKNTYLDRICEIVSRIGAGDSGRHSNSPEDFKLTSPERTALPTQPKLPLGVGSNLGAPTKLIPGARQYVVTDLSSNGLQPDAVGDVQVAQGDLAGALKSYRDSLAIIERLAQSDAGNSGWQRDLSVSYDHVGDVQVAQGDLAGALKSYRDSLAIRERLAQSDAGNAGWQRDLSVSYNKVGDVQVAQGDLAGALKSYRDSLAIRERLAQSDAGNAGWQRDLSVSYDHIGDVQVAQGDLAGALKSYRDSLAIAERLAQSDAGNAGWQRDLSVSYNKVGDVQVAQGDLAGALKSYRDSLAIIERLAQSDAGNSGWQRDLSVSYDHVGEVQVAQGDLAGALKSYRDSLAIIERLAQSDAGNSGWQRDLSVSYDHVGDVQVAQGDLAGALKSYRDSLAIRERLAQSDAGNAGWQRDLSVSYNKVGDVQVAQGDLAGALKSYRDSLAIRERLAQSDAGNAGWQRDLSVSYDHIGDVQVAQGDLAGALKSYRDSLAIAERLAQSDAGNAGWQRDLSVSYDHVGDVQVAQGDLAGALKSYRDSLAIRERLAQSDPGNSGWQRDLAVSYTKLASVYRRSDDRDNALALTVLRQGQEIMNRLLRLAPDNAIWKRDVAWFDNQIAALTK